MASEGAIIAQQGLFESGHAAGLGRKLACERSKRTARSPGETGLRSRATAVGVLGEQPADQHIGRMRSLRTREGGNQLAATLSLDGSRTT